MAQILIIHTFCTDKTTCDWRITKSPEAVCFFYLCSDVNKCAV